MFDDQQPANAGQVPANLPIGEPPVDMFADTEAETPASSAGGPVAPIVSAPPSGTPPVPTAPSALEAGILRSKQPVQQPVSGGAEMYRIKEPSIGRGILLAVIVVVVAVILGGGGWYMYQRFVLQPQSDSFNPVPNLAQPLNPPVAEVPVSAPAVIPETGNDATATSATVTAEMKDQQILFGEPIDTDADGLDDATEAKLLTDSKNWDTDGDELSDGDEIKIWHTDPLKKDTDSDGYADGMEVKSGYNPNGAGRLFQPPTTTTQ